MKPAKAALGRLLLRRIGACRIERKDLLASHFLGAIGLRVGLLHRIMQFPQLGLLQERIVGGVADGFGGADEVVDLRPRQRARELGEAVRVDRRMVTAPAHQADDPPIVLHREDGADAAAGGRLGADDRAERAAEMVRIAPEHAGGVSDADLDLVFDGRLVAEIGQPRR